LTNASVYLYDTIEEYMIFYPKGQDELKETHLSSLWINDKSIVLVSDNRAKTAGYKPDFTKSLVYFDQGEEAFEKYEDQFEPIVSVEADPKTNSIVFSGQKIEQSLAVARKVQRGYGRSKSRINVSGYILYDDLTTRLNVILKPVTH
tara:strand:- start:4824 stop:5264 length:441 start_codon:yes stop_codon:yes gene_type:complete